MADGQLGSGDNGYYRGLDWLRGRGLTDETITEFSLGYMPETDQVIFPYFNGAGEEVWERRRKIEGEPKFWSPQGSHARLYNMKDVDSPVLYLTEGEVDTLTLWQFFANDSRIGVVGVPGASSFQEHWKYLFDGARVIIAFDGDQAGANGATRISKVLKDRALSVSTLTMPSGADVNSLYVKGMLSTVLHPMALSSG